MRIIIKTTIILLCFAILLPEVLALPRDFSAIVSPSEVQFQITDPIGNITGYDPINKTTLNNIPNTRYIFDAVPTGGDEPTKNDMFHKIHSTLITDNTTISNGTYKIKLFGSTIRESFQFEVRVFYHGYMGPQLIGELASSIYPNVTWTYEITVPAVPPATKNVPLIKVSSPQDLIIDLTTAGQLGYIGNAKFVAELTKEINEIEAERAKNKIDGGLTPAQKAKKEYTELLKEITEKYNKPESDEFVKQEAYTVLKEDLEYIIGHL